MGARARPPREDSHQLARPPRRAHQRLHPFRPDHRRPRQELAGGRQEGRLRPGPDPAKAGDRRWYQHAGTPRGRLQVGRHVHQARPDQGSDPAEERDRREEHRFTRRSRPLQLPAPRDRRRSLLRRRNGRRREFPRRLLPSGPHELPRYAASRQPQQLLRSRHRG